MVYNTMRQDFMTLESICHDNCGARVTNQQRDCFKSG